MKIGIIGCGSWGSAIANLLATIGHEVHMYTQSEKQYERIRSVGDNPGYLEDFTFHPSIEIHLSIEEAIDGADGIVLAVPTAAIRSCLEDIARVGTGARIINLAKGLEQGSHLRLSQVAKDATQNIGTGNGAHEVAAQENEESFHRFFNSMIMGTPSKR